MNLQKEIYDRFCLIEENKLITQDKVDEFLIENDILEDCAKEVRERLKVQLKSGKCSQYLIQQLARHICHLGEKFGEKIEFYNASEICYLIGWMEKGITSHNIFMHQPLKGFSKIHHSPYSSIGYSIVRNIKEFWYKNKVIKNEKFDDFQKTVNLYGKQNIIAIMNTMHTKAMMEKARKDQLKGEWLIYKEHNNSIYYLCLATHEEGDEAIYQNKLLSCLEEFPQLK